MKDGPVRKAMPSARSRRCLVAERDIVIPAGTIFRRAANERGGAGFVEVPIGHGRDFTSHLVVQLNPDAVASGDFREVEA